MVLRRLERGIPKTTHVAYSTHKKPLLVLLLSLALVGRSCAQVDTTISQLESQSVVLPCPVNIDKCGQLHSLNWFKGDNRIAAMLLGDSNVTNVNKQFDKRVTVEQNPYRLVIKDLKIDDEDIYLCDTTFFIPEETCDNFNGYRIELRVLENIVPPTEVVILDAKGDRIENGSVVGPMQERQSLKATCTVKNTRPQPEVAWFRGTKRLTTYSPTHDISDGLYTSTLELDWPMSREDLAQDIECRVKSAAIPNTTVTKFSVDLQVRPISIDISGLQHHTVQGSKVVLTCDIHGARPAVNLTWYNSSTVISADENDLTEIRIKSFEKNDGTYHTQSELIFNATRFENDRVFRCEAENVVLQINREKPISSALTLEVLYPPVVKVSPTSINVNTSEVVLLNCEYVANPASLTHVEWYRNDDLVNVNVTNHYKGGNSENVALVIKSAGKEDIGNYSCELSNTIGKGTSNRKINLDVQYVPSVEILMIPEGPVKESEESNVTLFCNVLDANPLILTKVRWYANSTLLKELPDCEETREDLCHIDPSKLLLESIGRGFFYNYSCEGFNSAGWGPRSEDKELMVHYEPGPAILSHFPLVAVKKKSVTFSCSVDDPGYPDSNRFVERQANQIYKIRKTQHAPLIDFHTVQALQPQEADIAFEALLLHKDQKQLQSIVPSQISFRTREATHQAHEIKETHAIIDLHLNHSLCTLLTLTTYMPQSQIIILYTGVQQIPDSNASTSSYTVYGKRGKFSFVAQIVSKPNRFRWLRGGRGPLQDIVTKDWTVEPVGLDSRTNYSCYAYNEGGKGVMATVNLEVHAPPFFIKNLPPYTGMLHSSSNATLTCRIECVPRCEISWQKDGDPIERNDTRYIIKEKYMEASPATGDFESMLSVLHFNMPNWPNAKFDIEADNANYTCVSSSNTVGGSIRSRTYFGIEFAPDNTTVSKNNIYVQEDTLLGRVTCNSRANPEPSYKWFFKNETISNEYALSLNKVMKKTDNGTYTCLAYNKHGSSTAETIIIVQFKPRCEIERREIDDQDTLICTAYGNPVEVDFAWSIKAENESVETLGSGDKKTFSEKSFYVLETDYAISRTYRCVANNTIGFGQFCEIEVAVQPKKQLAWWQLWETKTIIILLAAIFGLLLTVIIICCIIILICRRRRRQDKLHDKSSSLGEPLTEPGEYENLPFHGLQTAPNKYSTIRINFNNNKNAEPMVQQPKKLNENINQTWINHKHDRQTIPDQHTYQQGNINEQELQYVHRSQYNTTHRQLITDLHNQRLTELVTDRPVQQSTSSCFPNSYTEYYRQHQEQKIQIQMRGEEHQLMDVNSLSNSQLLNALENDCISTNTAIDRPERSALLNTNPFLAATNFNKLCDEVPESIISANHSNSALHLEDKFNSLRFPNGNKFKNRTHIENSLLGSTTSQSPSAIDMSYLSTCKRHNSFAYIDPNQQSTHFHDSPNYENMVDENTDDQSKQTKKNESNQNLTTILLHTHPATDKFKKHYRSQHIKQQKNDEGIGPDFQLIEPERITIYRSDSGISNSSYESQFPPLSQKRSQKKKRDIVNSFSGPSVRKHIYKKNIGAQNSAMIHDDSTNGDKSGEPIGNVSISLSYKPSIQYIDKTNQEDLRQQQLGHHGAISTSMHSICKSLKVTKVKTSIEKTQSLAVNTFLATNGKSNALSGNKKKKKLRRQTISSPYEQIQRHPYARRVKNCDVSREILGYSSEVHSSAQKFDSRDLQIASANDLLIRPIRLPLRKHHSFNYQSTQTANGKLQQLRMQLHLQLQERKEFKEEGTPLVLQLSERHAFKPISPTPIMTKSEEQQTRDHSQTGLFSQYSCRHNLKAAEDDEDPGYSFFEEDNIVDNGNYPTSDNLHTAPANSSSTWNAIENRTAGDS
ncbi:uncharacterized protein LOC108118341 isoform X10 [Drosophila eugracilis]|uniref:uncharacterized protein LOC108118341 isoform X10 n=1 Tax=Drosophila eugracilis TaxID=29029 RepID=UPI001BD9340C|nr:uncharacterized protein LOC108118341 isoform X10 [Drosophila eugracilis]